jgi:hypothetical protein
MGRAEETGQLSFLCSCGKKPIELNTLGCCRSRYDRRYRTLRFFGGLRERVLKRDRFGCRVCGANAPLVVHHRDGRNEARLLITLCAGCHMSLHHSYGSRQWLSGALLRLWRELHHRDPVQLQLSLKQRNKVKTSTAFNLVRMPAVSSKNALVIREETASR